MIYEVSENLKKIMPNWEIIGEPLAKYTLDTVYRIARSRHDKTEYATLRVISLKFGQRTKELFAAKGVSRKPQRLI